MIVAMAVITTLAMPMLRWSLARIPLGREELKVRTALSFDMAADDAILRETRRGAYDPARPWRNDTADAAVNQRAGRLNNSRKSTLARSRVFRREAERFLPARLM
jgi:hypothetical protein